MTKTSTFFALSALCSLASCGSDEAPGTDTAQNTAGTTSGTGSTGSPQTSNGTGTTSDTGSITSTVTSGSTGSTGVTTDGTMGGTTGTTGSVSTGVTGVTNTSSTGDATTSTTTTGGAGGAGTTGVTGDTVTSTTGSVDDGDCMTPPEAPPVIGWASQDGGTDGGGNATPTVVTSTDQFNSAASGNDARVIHVDGSLSGDFSIGSNKTIIGVCGAELRGSVSISGQQNVIVRNIKVIGYNCSDSPQDCSGGADAIGVRSSHHLWFDHLEVSDGSDGNLDMTNDSDYITISWTKFFYSTARTDPEQGASGHRFSNLIGGSDSDSGEYRITFHHNWWAENVDQRMPRSRFGDIHVFNNLYTSSGNSYCTNAGFSTRVLVENNIYRGVHNPLSPDDNGDMREEGNVFDDTTGNQSDNGGTAFDPPYDYDLDPTSGLDTLLQAEVGPHD